MKKTFQTLIAATFFLLISCTSQESALKKQAVSYGEKKWMEAVQKEAEEGINQSEWLRHAYIQFIKQRSEVQVQDLKLEGENGAVATVVVATYPMKLRRTLMEIANKVEPTKSRRFNFSEAVNLVRKQTNESIEPENQPLGTYKLTKSQNHWSIE